jgi:uncharacterized protein
LSSPIIINGQSIWPGENAELILSSYALPTNTIINIPLYVYRSEKPGPRVLFMAGMHGDETNGIEIIRNLIHHPQIVSPACGTIILLPLLNVAAFLNSSRELPDGRDLNRCFPGSKSGSLGSRIAYDICHKVLPNIDFGVDFHTGGSKINNYPQIRCAFNDEKSLELAKLFNPPFILDAQYRDKSLRREAMKLGKQILVYEGGESLRFNKQAITEGVYGCYKLLNGLGMANIECPANNPIMIRSTKWIRAKSSGLFRTTKKYGTYVEKQFPIGVIADPLGKKEQLLISPDDGFLIGINNQPVVNEGDALMNIGME